MVTSGVIVSSGTGVVLTPATGAGTSVPANGTRSLRIESVACSVTAGAVADVKSGTGDITIRAGQNVGLGDGVDVVTANAGTISVNAVAGALTMAGTSNVTATNSSARLRAQGDITLGNVTATNVLLDSDAGSVINQTGTTMNVTATKLSVEAQGSVGTSARHVTTSVDTLTVNAATGSIYVTEANGVTVDDVSVTVTEFNADATTTVVPAQAQTQSDLTTGLNGHIVLVATLGDIALNVGTATGAGTSVSANGTGSVRIPPGASTTRVCLAPMRWLSTARVPRR